MMQNLSTQPPLSLIPFIVCQEFGGDVTEICTMLLPVCPRVGEEVVLSLRDTPIAGVIRWRVQRVQHMDRLPTRLMVGPWEA